MGTGALRTPSVSPAATDSMGPPVDSGSADLPVARVVSLTTPMMNPTGRVVFPWDRPGDAISFEMTVEVQGDRSRVRAELFTNANHNDAPATYDALPMREVRADGNLVTYRVDVPIQKMGNYRATGRVSVEGGTGYNWASAANIGDIRFRPHDEAHDSLNMVELNVLSVNGGRGTFADLLADGNPATNGRYTLEFLQHQGINGLWVMPPFQRSVWDQRHPVDEAGSPYAAKNFFQVDPEYSARARELRAQGASEADVDQAANQEFRDFVDQAHDRGMRVIVDIALNHVGHNFEFADLFTRFDAAGNEFHEVRRNDFSQVVINPEQAALVAQRLADPSVPKYMEYIAPWMYASRSGDVRGAQSADDAMAGGNQWFDTKQLFTGGSYGARNPEQNQVVVSYLARVLEHWAVNMGVDGFRLDHLTGLPQTILEEALNMAQAEVDRHRPGVQLYFTGEDFFSAEYNIPFLDNIQDTWLRNSLLQSQSPGTLNSLLQNPYFDNREMINLTSHDEHRFPFQGNTGAAARLGMLLPLLGGAAVSVAGDEFGATDDMPFKQYWGIGQILSPDDAGRYLACMTGRANRARLALPELQDTNRGFPSPRDGRPDPDLFALSRFTDAGDRPPSLVFANFSNWETRENVFMLDGEARARIDPNRTYQVRDRLADQPDAFLWEQPLTGRELLDNGVFARVLPYQVQMLELVEV